VIQYNDAERLREIFSANLTSYMKKRGKTVADIAADLDVPYTTAASWAKAEKYPRMDKVQALADYFNVSKSELIEEPGNENEKPAVPGEPSEMEQLFTALSPRDRKVLLELAKNLKENEQ